MWESSLPLLRDPRSGERLELETSERLDGEVIEGALTCASSGARIPIRNGIPRFVEEDENYAENFGFEWDLFAEIQTDRLARHSLSTDRFFNQVSFSPGEMKGLRVLEAGCGGGRFSDVVLEAGAELFSFDLSNAVDKNRAIHTGHPRHHLFQASIFEPPFVPGSFDLVFCMGVLQHTPDPEAFFRQLIPFAKPGGELMIDVYSAHPKQSLHWKYALRPISKRLPHRMLLRGIEAIAPVLVPISRQVRRIPKLGKPLSRLIPIFVHDGFMGLIPREDEVRFAVLETFDALSPAYDRPRSLRTMRRWFRDAGFEEIHSFNVMNALNVARGRAPAR
jgi:2-polyprenyl-3-methyl-5-hydroxy-6-metoxy-1,4-benzoquinol methylase